MYIPVVTVQSEQDLQQCAQLNFPLTAREAIIKVETQQNVPT
jgi:hypothetical protein